MSLPTVVYCGPAALCILSWLGLGRVLPRRVLSGDALLDTLTRLAAGSVVVTLVVFVLGRTGALDGTALLAATAVLAVPGALVVGGLLRRSRLPRLRRSWPTAVAAVVVVALAVDVVASTAPPTSADALVYHLEFPRLWLESGHIGDLFWSYASFYPLGIESLYAQAMSIVGGASASAFAVGCTASALHGLIAVLAALAVYGLARDLGGRRAGLLGCALFVLQGLFTWDSTSAFVDMGLTLYAVLAAWHVLRFARLSKRSSAAFAGAFVGAACGAKYIGLLVAVFTLVPLAVVALRQSRARDLPLALGLVLLVAAPWYARNAIETGNPVYPLIFGGRMWTPAAQRALDAAGEYYQGTNGIPLRILILPLDLLLHGERFDRGEYASTATLLLAPLALLVARTRETTGILLAAFGYVIAWWYAAPQVRYLLPVFAVLAAVGGVAVEQLLAKRGPHRPVLAAALVAAAGVWLASSIALTRQLLPAAVGAESGAANVERLTGTYDAIQAIARRFGHRPVAFAAYRFTYWYPGRAIELGVPEFGPSLPRQAYIERLRSAGVTTIVHWTAYYAELKPIEDCIVRLDSFTGRFVLSRARGHSVPLRFDVYSTARCLRRNASVVRSAAGVPIS